MRASARTIAANRLRDYHGAYVAPGGYWVPPSGFSTLATFDRSAFINNILAAHRQIPDVIVQPTAVEALNKIVALCRIHGVELHMVVTPNYPWDDYRLLSLGYRPLLDQWLRELSKYENVVSISQYNEILEEAPGEGMRWWYDPLHFNRETGALILKALSGQPAPGTPGNFMVPVTPESVEKLITARWAGLESWMRRNPDFGAAFEAAKEKAGGPVDRR